MVETNDIYWDIFDEKIFNRITKRYSLKTRNIDPALLGLIRAKSYELSRLLSIYVNANLEK